ncbi:aminoacyl-histidine dipeptidase [candidate division KSB1 bacterium]
MSNTLSGLKPESLWKHFEGICSVPHPSKKEEKIREFVKNFGESLGLETIIDEIGNVIIKKPATPGMENKKGVILQGHIDMVPQKNSDTAHDFDKDPIQAYIDGEWVKAKGTTLGSDNGIGVAAAMAILESTDIAHPPVEALFTIDEETGMTGANELKSGILSGDILINMDSEDEGELYIGCAGGVNTNMEYIYSEDKVPEGMAAYKISVTGLKGGHSGLDIHLGRGNANLIINKLMMLASEKFGLRLADIDGGSLRNAIPREAFATVVVKQANENNFKSFVNDFYEEQKVIYKQADPGLNIKVEPIATPANLINESTQKNLFKAVDSCPNGVISMDPNMPDVVQTSTNLAVIKSENGIIEIATLQRSAVDADRDAIAKKIADNFTVNGAKAEFSGRYPGWKPNVDSPILQTMKDVYNNNFGKVPEVKVIHAGLECGILGDKYPHWDMISFGPTIRNPHSPDEMVNIKTVEKFFDFLVETLKNIPNKN